MSGAASPVLLLGPYGRELWSELIAVLGDPDWVVVPFGMEASLTAAARRILADAPATFDLVCHCAGACLAFEMLRLAPGRVGALALINASAAADSDASEQARRGRIAKLEEKRSRHSLPDADYLDLAIPWLLSAASRGDPATVARARSALAAFPLEGALAQQRAMLGRPDSHPLVDAAGGPILLVGGREDRICPPERTSSMEASAPRADCAILEDCGHLAPIEAPIALARLLAKWRERRVHGADGLPHKRS